MSFLDSTSSSSKQPSIAPSAPPPTTTATDLSHMKQGGSFATASATGALPSTATPATAQRSSSGGTETPNPSTTIAEPPKASSLIQRLGLGGFREALTGKLETATSLAGSIKRTVVSLPHKTSFDNLQRNFNEEGKYNSVRKNTDKPENLTTAYDLLTNGAKCFRLNAMQIDSFVQFVKPDLSNPRFEANPNYSEHNRNALRLLRSLQENGSLTEKEVDELRTSLSAIKQFEHISANFNPDGSVNSDKLKEVYHCSKAVEALRNNSYITPQQRTTLHTYVEHKLNVAVGNLLNKNTQQNHLEEFIQLEEKRILSQLKELKNQEPSEGRQAQIKNLVGELKGLRKQREDKQGEITKAASHIQTLVKEIQEYNNANPDSKISIPKNWKSVDTQVQDMKAGNLARRMVYDQTRAEMNFGAEKTDEKLQKTRDLANRTEELTTKARKEVDFIAASNKSVWEHANGAATPNSSEMTTLETSGLTVGCATLTNFKDVQNHKPEDPLITNEDRYLAMEIEVSIGGQVMKLPLMGVFDGHGPEGDRGSEFVKQNLPNYLSRELSNLQQPLKDEDIFKALRQAFIKCNSAFNKQYPGANFGSTAVVSVVLNGALWVANVGDSRAMIASKAGPPIALSYDATPDENDPAIKARVEKREGVIQGDRVGGNLQLSSAFGDFATPGISASPKIARIPLSELPPDARLVIGCDGLFDAGTSQEVSQVAMGMGNANPEQIARSLANRARNAVPGAAGGEDIQIKEQYLKNVKDFGDVDSLFQAQLKKLGANPSPTRVLGLIAALERGMIHMQFNPSSNDKVRAEAYIQKLREKYTNTSITQRFVSFVKRVTSSQPKGPVNEDDITVLVCDLSKLRATSSPTVTQPSTGA